MKVTAEDLARVAVLSRLAIDPAEEESYLKELDSFLNYVDNLNRIDTDDIEPTTYPLPISNVFRADEVKASLARDAALANAPYEEDGYFKVPKVLEG
ncbi:Asp-tRNA(Asn)/Glu-tRNA(Gln) amidotransferase subunit GatC [Selenomonas sp. TAMA-11512]|uniref:Asp-tRNA(Asn)/Glu-tRNA(Gln) amidotransferase subunit GatC n=1 Tax=Selenomonas sp. TAMA-11512 TaxID=3095337 RepID=UPI00308D74EB|nr:Asp-tRNA(Asn)/Glu-tRNA(Gln) amidotransferase subunit GatC [Selenomonas sp. TAMA-11512]